MHFCRILLLISTVVLISVSFATSVQTVRAQTCDTDGGRAELLGDMGGLRPFLSSHGISFGLSETDEALGNATGGLRRGVEYDGITTMTLELDTDKAFGWKGGDLFMSALQIHGRNLGADNLDSLQAASNIEADRTTRLWELWFQQMFWNGKGSVKIGRQDLSEEFLVSRCCSIFMNSAMGWPALPAADLYAGGPVYPLSSLGMRLALQSGRLSFQAGVFDDNPPGGPFDDDSQLRDGEASGTRFNLTTGALVIGELGYAVELSPDRERSCKGGLQGLYKLGFWYDTGKFPQYDPAGLPEAGPANESTGFMHRGNFSLYGIADQTVWRQSGGPRSAAVFTHVMGAPSDRNLVDWSLTTGVNVFAPFSGRDSDTFGLGYGFAHLIQEAADFDGDTAFFTGAEYPVRGFEHFIEITYQYQATPWLIVQPDFQYILQPRAGISDPLHPSKEIGDELIIGVRTVVKF